MQKGEIIDRYRLDERLGAGTFGEVWRASQLADGEDVGVACAIKVMKLSHDRSDSSVRGMATGWLDEVRNLVRVAGRTIPRIHEANVWNEHAYIAMELLEGTTLGARLAKGAVPWRRALFIADQIANALAAAHEVRVIHRDIKPQNVILVGADRVCVIDWGIATLSSRPAAVPSGVAPRSEADPDATDAGPVAPIATPQLRATAVGTPGYMAPEVYDGASPTRAQDVFALGVVLYEMIAGRLPQDVARPDDTLKSSDAVRNYRSALDRATMDGSLVPLRERCPGVPSAVAELVDALLARDPERRPTDVLAAIDRASRFPHGIPDPPYAGLVKLGPERAGLFFGQKESIQHVLERLRTQRAALLWGPSGSGKSSLALAGVAATMDRTLFGGTDGWTIHVARPRDGRVVRASPSASIPPRSPTGHVVVIDQLEEVVDLAPAERDAFCAGVLALVNGDHGAVVNDAPISPTDEVRVVATIRDDLEWRVDREVPALRPLLELRAIVDGVDANFARSIIEEPARALGYTIDGVEAASREVEERLSADASKLPVVQYALSEWWQRRDQVRRVLPTDAWRELGGVDGALSTVAERFYTSLDGDAQLRAKALFLQLFVGERKQPVPEAGLGAADLAIIEELVRLRLVGRRFKKGSAPFYEVEHESLARNWNRLAEWLAEARDDRQLADELERDAAVYQRDRDDQHLWKRGRLATALEMASRGRVALTREANAFLEQAQRLARSGRTLRIAAGVAIVAVAIGVGYLVLLNSSAYAERDRAVEEVEKAKKELEETSRRTQAEIAKAKDETTTAARAKREADAAKADAEARKAELEKLARDAKQESDTATKERDLATRERKRAEAAADACQKEQARTRALCNTGFGR